MNRWAYQQKALVGGCVANGVVCPKPRRIGLPLHFHDPIRPLSCLLHFNNQQADVYDSKVGTVLLDITLSKVPSSPPFFTGSPPSRASNPVIQDEQFGNASGNHLLPALDATSSPIPSTCKSRCRVPVNFGPKPVPVRIEGFNCRGSCSIDIYLCMSNLEFREG